MEIFTNREIAVLFWGSVGALIVFAQASLRKFVWTIVQLLGSKSLMPILLMTAAYIAVVVSILAALGLWNFSHLKITLAWALLVAFVEMFRMPKTADEFISFHRLIFDQIKILVIVEYLIGYTSFSLPLEMVLFPILTLLVILQSVAEGKDDLRPAYNVLTTILAIIAVFYLWAALREIIASFESFASFSTLTEFALPPTLTILFLPYLFVLTLYSIYQTEFSTLKVFIDEREIRQYALSLAILNFGANVELLHRWRRDVILSKPKSKEEVLAITREVIRRKKTKMFGGIIR